MAVQLKTVKTLPTREVCRILDINRHVLARMIEKGYFTHNRRNPELQSGPYRVHIDELQEYQRLRDKGLPMKRVLSGMIDYRGRQGRK